VSIGSRIRTARKAKNMTQKELSTMASVSATSIVYWERDEIEPKSKNLASLARALNVAPDYLVHGAVFGEGLSIAPLHSRVPLLKWADLNNGLKMEKANAESWLYCPTQCGEGTFALRVDNDLMVSQNQNSKSYPEGTIIFIDPDAPLRSGCRVIAKKLNSLATFKEYIVDGGDAYLKPINPQYPTVLMESDTEIIGIIIGSYSAE